MTSYHEQAIKGCIRALDKSSSRKMLEANLRFIWDRYMAHPSPELPEHLREPQPPKP